MTGTVLGEIQAITGVKSNITTFNYVYRFIVHRFYFGRILLKDLNTPILKVQGSALWAQHPLTAGSVRRQFPSLRNTTWRNNGSSTRNGFRFEYHIRILRGESWHSLGEIENIMLSSWLRPTCRCLLSQYSLMRTVREIPQPNGLGIWLPIRTRHRALSQQTPPEAVLIH